MEDTPRDIARIVDVCLMLHAEHDHRVKPGVTGVEQQLRSGYHAQQVADACRYPDSTSESELSCETAAEKEVGYDAEQVQNAVGWNRSYS